MKQLIRTIAMLLASVFVVAQGEDKGTVAGVEPISGKQLYSSYCALCHGVDGKGGGPFSPQLKVWPIDLTQLAKKNHGVFPEMHVREAIDGEFGRPSHGNTAMPIWGLVFRSMAHGHRTVRRSGSMLWRRIWSQFSRNNWIPGWCYRACEFAVVAAIR